MGIADFIFGKRKEEDRAKLESLRKAVSDATGEVLTPYEISGTKGFASYDKVAMLVTFLPGFITISRHEEVSLSDLEIDGEHIGRPASWYPKKWLQLKNIKCKVYFPKDGEAKPAFIEMEGGFLIIAPYLKNMSAGIA